MPEKSKTSEQNKAEGGGLFNETTSDIVDWISNDPRLQKEIFGRVLDDKEKGELKNKITPKIARRVLTSMGGRTSNLEGEIENFNKQLEIDKKSKAINLVTKINELKFGAETKEDYQQLTELYRQIERLYESGEGKELPKPEKTKSETIIIAENEKGEPVEFDLEQIKQKSIEFYKKHNLEELANEIENIDPSLTEEQIDQLREKAKEGFDSLWFFPAPEILHENLQKIIKETTKPLPGLKDDQQYSDKAIFFSETVKPDIDKIQTNNRPSGKPYFQFTKSEKEVPLDTMNKTARFLRDKLTKEKKTGFTLPEYFIFQRQYTETHKAEDAPHPDTSYWTWLLDSEFDSNSTYPGRVLGARWYLSSRHVGVYSFLPSDAVSDGGARSSAIFEI